MRRSAVFVFALLLATTGCFTAQPDCSITHFGIQGPFQGPRGDDVVQLDVAILERTVGDRFINKDLWQLTDEAVSPELKPILQENGFRACQTGCTPPPGLLDLLSSERCNPNPRRILTRAGNPTTLLLGSPWDNCVFNLDHDHLSVPRELHKAQCVLTVLPTLSEDGRVTLRFAPEVHYGARAMKPHVIEEPDGTKSWTMLAEQPMEAPRWLAWELRLKSNEFVAVGTLLDQPETIGHHFFVQTETAAPVQRLLVIRVSRAPPPDQPDIRFDERAPPLSLQVDSR